MAARLLTVGMACAALALAGCGGSDSSADGAGSSQSEVPASTGANAPSKRKAPTVVPPKGPAPKKLVKKELIEGTGREAKTGDSVTVHYVGVGYKSGIEFASSWKGKEPFTFTLGQSETIRGWEEGIPGMRVGGRRELITPPKDAYGSKGTKFIVSGKSFNIVPGATLVYVIDLLGIK